MKLLKQFSTVGLLLGTLLFAFSLTPSLMPRPFYVQGLVSGLSFTAGYAIGIAARWLWMYMEIPILKGRAERNVKIAAAIACAGVAVLFLWRASDWQNSVRALMGMDPVTGIRPINVMLIAALVFVAAIALAWLIRWTFRFLAHHLHIHLPRRVAIVLGAVATFTLFWLIVNGVIFRALLRALDTSYRQFDALVMDDLDPPTDPIKTGSAESYVDWADLGREGRAFIATGPTAADISAFTGEEAVEPIRIYIGLNAADTAQGRAQLALQELLRVDAFDRSILIVVTPTGSGWMDPASHDIVEYLHRGDIATVAAQYSYLPSGLSIVVEGDYGVEMARALFDVVYDHWRQLPRDNRPALYLHGLSLGALNSELSFHAHDILDDPFQGALWVGPPFRSEPWNLITANREAGSPAWLPRYRDSSIVRFMNQHGGLDMPGVPWGPLRIAYLQYASDPITFFSVNSLFQRPEWMYEPRGPDVSPQLRWYPVVTFLQLLADMAFGGAPPGYGHEFAGEHYLEAWLALTEPAGWTAEDLERLRAMHRQRSDSARPLLEPSSH